VSHAAAALQCAAAPARSRLTAGQSPAAPHQRLGGYTVRRHRLQQAETAHAPQQRLLLPQAPRASAGLCMDGVAQVAGVTRAASVAVRSTLHVRHSTSVAYNAHITAQRSTAQHRAQHRAQHAWHKSLTWLSQILYGHRMATPLAGDDWGAGSSSSTTTTAAAVTCHELCDVLSQPTTERGRHNNKPVVCNNRKRGDQGMQYTCSTHAVHMQYTCSTHAVHMQYTCSTHTVKAVCPTSSRQHILEGRLPSVHTRGHGSAGIPTDTNGSCTVMLHCGQGACTSSRGAEQLGHQEPGPVQCQHQAIAHETHQAAALQRPGCVMQC
jgi:hypothetical protein